ncbi:MAG: class I SAM-dependent methyltransferase [Acidobacteria bacterium]|nr:class I SAM-dependent methyltransferase [Acidobacteriota bacterium]
MRDQDLEYTYELEEDFWWFQGMRAVTLGWIGHLRPRLVLDAGCGTGFHLQWLRQKLGASSVMGIDLSETALRFARSRDAAAPLARASVAHLPFAGESFDLVTSFDVISQIPPQIVSAALWEFGRVLRAGGYFFVRVPAARWLYSSHDEELQTYARYSLPELVKLLSAAGFTVVRSSYANYFLFPVALVRRILKRLGLSSGSDVRPFPKPLLLLEPVFLWALRQEARLLADGGRQFPFGLSAIALARKT